MRIDPDQRIALVASSAQSEIRAVARAHTSVGGAALNWGTERDDFRRSYYPVNYLGCHRAGRPRDKNAKRTHPRCAFYFP
jgi:hypothetical protein